MSGFVLDTGALIAIERNDRFAVSLVERARQRGHVLTIPTGCLAQAWRGGARQARLAALLRHSSTVLAPLDGTAARRVGELLARARTVDVVDGHVALLALETRATVLTSDAGDIRRLAPRLSIAAV